MLEIFSWDSRNTDSMALCIKVKAEAIRSASKLQSIVPGRDLNKTHSKGMEEEESAKRTRKVVRDVVKDNQKRESSIMQAINLTVNEAR